MEEPDRSPLESTVRRRYPDEEAEEILRRVQWDGLMGCWLYLWRGMTLGIEPDGYGPHS